MNAALLVSGLLGFLAGVLVFPSWQVAVETSQAVAGIVRYPADNPFGIYHAKLWTILHQICAPLLRLGVSEIVLSKAVSGLLGMVSAQSYAMVIYALSRHTLLAVGATFVLLVGRLDVPGAPYPFDSLDTIDTYGVLGLSVFVLVVGLFGAGSFRLAAFLLGLAPAIHAGLGFWLMLVVAICFMWDVKNLRGEWRPGLKYFVAGCLVSALSLAVQLAMMRGVPPIDPAEASRYLSAFVKVWDWHRAPLGFWTRSVALNVGVAAIALTWLTAFRASVPRPAVFLLRAIVVCAILSLIFVELSQMPQDALPTALLILMPTRLVDINVMMSIPLALGLLALHRSPAWSRAVIACLLAGLLLSSRRVPWEGVPPLSAFRDRTNDPFFATVAAEKQGFLLTGGSLHLLQLRTRRPVLLDGGGLDGLPYALESGPEMRRILIEAYGIDLLNPPIETERGGVIPDGLSRPIWEGYSREKWRDIGRTFDVTQIVAPADWQLTLPVAAERPDLRLYRIPE